MITHGTDTLIETAKYLGSRSTAEGDGNTSFLLFFVVFFGGGRSGVWNAGFGLFLSQLEEFNGFRQFLLTSPNQNTCTAGVMEMC